MQVDCNTSIQGEIRVGHCQVQHVFQFNDTSNSYFFITNAKSVYPQQLL